MHKKILDLIYSAIDEVNEQLPVNMRMEKSIDEKLYEKSGKLDSLGLVNLIVATEQLIETKFGKSVILSDENALSQKMNPFKTVGTFAKYTSSLLENSI